jgi:MFS family permease
MAMKRKIFYGWWVLIALFFVGMLGPMARYTVTALGPFISEEMGWGATSMGLALSMSLWIYALASLPVGWLIDRVGSRRILIMGGILLFMGLWWFSKVNVLWQLYLSVGLIIGIGVSMTHFLATQSTARKWFSKKAGLAGGHTEQRVVSLSLSLHGWSSGTPLNLWVYSRMETLRRRKREDPTVSMQRFHGTQERRSRPNHSG